MVKKGVFIVFAVCSILCTKYDVLRVCTVYIMATSIYTTLGVVSTVYSEYSLLVRCRFLC